ncbi:MAG: hypothetical protein KDE04_24980, partial [Anaerolineales bacterium]|nr:hypothetical protein [Anaerolineales bacterium]
DSDNNGTYDTLVGTTTSAGDGTYSFTDLPDGEYVVSVNPSSPPIVDSTLTTSSNQNDGPAFEYVTLAGVSVTDVDFGYYTYAPTALLLSALGVVSGGGAAWPIVSVLLVAVSVVGLALNRRWAQN